MNAPIRIAFATDTASAKSGMQDLAASIAGSMVKTSLALGTTVKQADRLGIGLGDAGKLAKTGIDLAASGVKIGAEIMAADFKLVANAANDSARRSNASMQSIATATGKAAAETKTAAIAMDAARAGASASAAFSAALLRKEIASASATMMASPLFRGLAGTAAAIAAFELISTAVSAATERLDAYAKIAERARNLDVGAAFLQGFTDQAKTAGLEIKDLQDALDHFHRASKVTLDDGESAIGKRMIEIFRSGYLGEFNSKGMKLFENAQNDEQRIRGVLEAMRELRDLGLQVAAVDLGEKAFGDKFADGIRSGRIELDEFIRRTGDAKIPDDVIQSASELKKRLNEAWQEIEDNLKTSMLSLKPIEDGLLAVWVKIVETIAAGTRALNDFAAAGPSFAFGKNPFTEDLTSLMRLIGRIKDAGTPVSSPDSPRDPNDPRQRQIRLPNWNDPSTYPSGARNRPDPAWDQPGYVSADERRRPSAVVDPNTNAPLPPRRAFNMPTSEHGAGGGGGESERIDAIERLVRSMEKANETAKAELDTVGKSNVEKEKAVALAKLNAAAKEAGRASTEQEIADVTRLAEATAHLKDKLKDQQQAAQQAAEAMRNFGQMGVDALADMILEGKSFDDVMKNLAKTLAKQALNGLLMGTGPMAGLLGTAAPASGGSNAVGGLLGMITSGFRANGGPVSAGRAYTVGEVGEEIFVPDQDGRMVPVSRGGGAFGGGAGGGVTVNNYMGGQAEVETKRGQDGSLEVGVRAIEGRMAQRAQSGRGPMAQMYGSSAYRRG